MNNSSLITQLNVQLLDESASLSLEEFIRACASPTELVLELVEEGILKPEGPAPEHWRFSGTHLKHARVALRLQRDLGVNLAGAALALQLLDELEELRARLSAMHDVDLHVKV
jgi:chaperone modulatory protein CbpM